MTVMIERYFGIPQQVIRMGLWAQMKPSEQSLNVCLMHESERYSTRRLQKTDATLSKMAGLSPRAFCNARKKLQERKLVACKRSGGNIYEYTICNPETGLPWPGDPKARIHYLKKESGSPQQQAPVLSEWTPPASTPERDASRKESSQSNAHTTERSANRSCGIPLSFGKIC